MAKGFFSISKQKPIADKPHFSSNLWRFNGGLCIFILLQGLAALYFCWFALFCYSFWVLEELLEEEEEEEAFSLKWRTWVFAVAVEEFC